MIKKDNQTIGAVYKGSTPIRKIYKGSVLVWKRELPYGYTQVDYITSDGNSYIDTKLSLSNNFIVDVDFSYNQKTWCEQPIVSIWKEQYNYWNLFVTSDGLLDLYVSAHHRLSVLTMGEKYNSRVVRNGKNFTFELNKGEKLESFERDSLQDNPTTFKILNRGDLNGISHNSIYKLKVYKDNVLTLDMVPCYRNSDNEIGLYDLVTNTFYTNAGTGTFTYGSVVPNPDSPIEIQSFGDLITDSQDEHYGKYKIPVNVNNTITNIYLDEPLRKIGDYADYIDYENQKVVRNIKEIILDGSESWTNAKNVTDTNIYFSTRLIDGLNVPNNGLSDMFTYITNLYTEDAVGFQIISNTNNLRVRIPATKLSDISSISQARISFVNWLRTHNFNVYYVLATPTEETIELPNILLNEGTNIVDVETSITPSNLLIKYKGK